MAGKKAVKIYYRKYQRPVGAPQTLEQMVRAAMESADGEGVRIRERYKSRLQVIGTDSYFINLFMPGTQEFMCVSGDILHFTRGHLQALCQIADENAAALPVQQMQAPEMSEYVHSQMFWMIKGDHVFVVQSMSLRTADLENYFSWLLSQKTNILPENLPVVLAAKFNPDAVGGDLQDIQEIIVGGVAARPVNVSTQEKAQGNDESVGAARRINRNTAARVLSELMDGDASVDSLLSAVPADADLRVRVHIGFETKRRRIERTALKQLETGLRNLPDGELQIKSKNQELDTSGQIRLQFPALVRLLSAQVDDNQMIGSLLDPFDVRRSMFKAYQEFVTSGKIEAN